VKEEKKIKKITTVENSYFSFPFLSFLPSSHLGI
jgi:hypothetical protein